MLIFIIQSCQSKRNSVFYEPVDFRIFLSCNSTILIKFLISFYFILFIATKQISLFEVDMYWKLGYFLYSI